MDASVVWVPGESVDLDRLRREYDPIQFTRAAIRVLENQMRLLISAMEARPSGNEAESDADEALLDESYKILAKLTEVL